MSWRPNKIKNRVVKNSVSQYFYTANTLDTSLDRSHIERMIEKGYLHSTVAGFNAAYTEITRVDNIVTKAEKLADQGYADLQSAISMLQTETDPTINLVWGEPIPGMAPQFGGGSKKNPIPTLDHHRIAYAMLNNSPAALASKEFLASYESWIKVHTAYIEAGKQDAMAFRNISTLKKPAVRFLKAARQLVAIVKQYDEISVQVIGSDVTGHNRNFTDYADALAQLEAWNSFDDINKNTARSKVSAFQKLAKKLSQFFGYETEQSRGMDLWLQGMEPGDIPAQIQQGNIFNVQFAARSTKLSDITFDVSVPEAEDYKLQRMGVSLKHRTFGGFDLGATFTLPENSEYELQALMYIYSNMLALATFTRDKEQSYGRTHNRKQSSYNARYNTTKRGMSEPLKKATEYFRLYLTYRLLLTAFFGNGTNAGSGSALDENFFKRLVNKMQKDNEPPPHFVMTGRHVYCTYQIIQHYLDAKELTESTEWKNLLELGKYPTDYSYKELQGVWDRKAKILEQADQGMPLHGVPAHVSVYDLLLQEQNFEEIFKNFQSGKDKKARMSKFRLQHHITL